MQNCIQPEPIVMELEPRTNVMGVLLVVSPPSKGKFAISLLHSKDSKVSPVPRGVSESLTDYFSRVFNIVLLSLDSRYYSQVQEYVCHRGGLHSYTYIVQSPQGDLGLWEFTLSPTDGVIYGWLGLDFIRHWVVNKWEGARMPLTIKEVQQFTDLSCRLLIENNPSSFIWWQN